MPNIITVLCFLSIFSLLNKGINELSSAAYEKMHIESSHRQQREHFSFLQASRTYSQLKAPEHKSNEPSFTSAIKKNKRFKRKQTHPRNSKLNLNLLCFYKDQMEATFKRLIIHIYASTEIGSRVQSDLNSITEGLSKNIRTKNLKLTHDIATIDFNNPSIQTTWYLILKGKKGSYPSLLEYVTIISQKWLTNTGKLNIHYASKELIESLSNSASLSEEIIALREPFISSQNIEKEKMRPIFEKHLSEKDLEIINLLIDYTKGMPFHSLLTDEEEA